MRIKFFNFLVKGVVVFCVLVFSNSSAFAAIDVKAGEPGKIVLTVESPAKAGEPFLAKIEVRDAYDNLLVNYHQMGKPIKLTTTGKGKLNPGIIVPSEFIEGVAQVMFTYNKAEAITITATEEISGKQSESKVTVESGKVNRFLVAAPSGITAGQNFSLRIEAYDIFGNLATDYSSKNKGVEITMGTGKVVPSIIPASGFVGGIASVEATCTKAQAGAISVMDITERAYGKSAIVRVESSEAKRFLVSAPVQGVAGEAFTVRIEAYDAFDNLVTSYNKTGRGILITPQGPGKISPNEIPSQVFINGVATISLSYDRAEPLELIITEKPGQLPAEKKSPQVTPAAEKPKEATKPAAEKKEEVTPAVEKSKEEVAPADKISEAKVCYERAVKAINMNKYEEAKKALEKCISLDPTNTEAKKLLDRLNTIIKLETR